MYTLRSIAERATAPTRIVLLSDGFVVTTPNAKTSLMTDLTAVLQRLNERGTTVYAIDAKGMQGFLLGLDSNANPIDPGRPGTMIPQGQSALNDVMVEGMIALCVDTGGRFLANEDDLNRAFQQIGDARAAFTRSATTSRMHRRRRGSTALVFASSDVE